MVNSLNNTFSDYQSSAFNIKAVSEKLLEIIPDMVFVKGPKSRLLWANKSFQDYYGMSNEQLKGLIDSPINDPDATLQYIKDDAQVFNTGMTLDIKEEPVTRFDGVVRFFNTKKAAVRDNDGKISMTIGISRDITEEKLANEKRDAAVAELTKMNTLLVDRELKMVELKNKLKTET